MTVTKYLVLVQQFNNFLIMLCHSYNKLIAIRIIIPATLISWENVTEYSINFPTFCRYFDRFFHFSWGKQH